MFTSFGMMRCRVINGGGVQVQRCVGGSVMNRKNESMTFDREAMTLMSDAGQSSLAEEVSAGG